MLTVTPVAGHPNEVIISGGEEVHEWRERHRLDVPGAEHSYRYQRGEWDGKWAPGKWCRQVGDTFELRCSRGLVERIVGDFGGAMDPLADDHSINLFIAEHADVFDQFQGDRAYQYEAFVEVLRHGWGRIAFATNAGKGAVIALLALYAVERQGVRALILCDEVAVFEALMEQEAEWAQWGAAPVSAGVKTPPDADIVIAMVPTLSKRLHDKKTSAEWRKWAAQFRMVLLDEADKADNDTWKRCLAATGDTPWRAGFSGTFPEDLLSVLRFETLMGPTLLQMKNKALVERGISARPLIEVHAFAVQDELSRVPRAKDWWAMSGPERRRWTYDRVVLRNQRRHAFIVALIDPDQQTAIIVNRLDHGQELADAIPGAVFLEGAVSKGERDRVLTQFQQGEVRVLVVTKILDRGTNRLGSAQDLIFAAAEGSDTQLLQRLGRGLRRTDGKATLRLVDIVDRCTPTDDRVLASAQAFLHNATRKRLQLYAQEGFDVALVPSHA